LNTEQKKVLLIHYTQTGQLGGVMKAISGPLTRSAGISVRVETLRPKVAFPFPWPFFRFFDTFPETVYGDCPELESLAVDPDEHFDLVILGYQAWFLSPSLPMQAFLKSPEAARLLKGRPVVTVVACRDMWLKAQEIVKQSLAGHGARHVGHVALVDEAGTVGSFLATPLWMLTGKPGPRLGGLIPKAGVAPEKVAASSRFGERMAETLESGAPLDESLLRGLDAVRVNTALISSENAVRRGFRVWGGLLRALGPQGHWRRKIALVAYVLWLVLAIVVLVPLGYLLRKIFGPLRRRRLAELAAYYAAPSEP
jgi:hypothetical protein